MSSYAILVLFSSFWGISHFSSRSNFDFHSCAHFHFISSSLHFTFRRSSLLLANLDCFVSTFCRRHVVVVWDKEYPAGPQPLRHSGGGHQLGGWWEWWGREGPCKRSRSKRHRVQLQIRLVSTRKSCGRYVQKQFILHLIASIETLKNKNDGGKNNSLH